MVLRLADDIEIDEALFEVRRAGQPVPLEPQAFDVLLHLVRHRDRIVPKEELMDSIWGGRFVSETTVTSRIKQVRKALGDDGQAQRCIRTLHGRGYRFVAEVVESTESADSVERVVPTGAAPVAGPSPVEQSPIRYTTSDGLHIAYQVTGSGPIDIVLISGFVSHLEVDWDDPRHAYFLERLGAMGRLIRFDKRGTGMSDRPPGVPDLETRMHDVLAVMDAVGSQKAVICGYSEGGPMAMLMAAMHPERVSGLVLYGTYARRVWAEDYPYAQTAEARAAWTEELVTNLDWEADLRYRCPSGDDAMAEWWARRMRASATPGTVRQLMDMNALVDVRGILPSLRVPTLVLHRRGDAMFTWEEGQYIADRIPGARLELLDGEDHFVSGDPKQIVDAIEPFITPTTVPDQPVALAAVVVSRGAGAEELTSALVAGGGRRRLTTSGETAVLFDGPATGVRAGINALTTGHTAGIGLAIAEVPVGDLPVSGDGVDAAVDLAGRAPVGAMLVSHMASLLLMGSGIQATPFETSDDAFLVSPA
ncbi:alpha/beta fold hydrolase [Marmoricola sp. OAE513]|uniref:alpha/beta fold hydrolase n=1 Tax=Marmoricola sp. OAE513 TaxID=2817894 RepID=UPI001AE3C0EF